MERKGRENHREIDRSMKREIREECAEIKTNKRKEWNEMKCEHTDINRPFFLKIQVRR